MGSSPVSIKISKKELVKKIEAERVKAIARFEKAEKTFERRLATWRSKAAAKCTKVAQDITAGKRDPKPGERYFGRSVELDSPPTPPQRDEYVAHWDRTLDWVGKSLSTEITLHKDAYERLVYGRVLS